MHSYLKGLKSKCRFCIKWKKLIKWKKKAKETHAEVICIEVENDCVLQVSHLFNPLMSGGNKKVTHT